MRSDWIIGQRRAHASYDKYFWHEIWYLWFLSSDDFVEKPQTRNARQKKASSKLGIISWPDRLWVNDRSRDWNNTRLKLAFIRNRWNAMSIHWKLKVLLLIARNFSEFLSIESRMNPNLWLQLILWLSSIHNLMMSRHLHGQRSKTPLEESVHKNSQSQLPAHVSARIVNGSALISMSTATVFNFYDQKSAFYEQQCWLQLMKLHHQLREMKQLGTAAVITSLLGCGPHRMLENYKQSWLIVAFNRSRLLTSREEVVQDLLDEKVYD